MSHVAQHDELDSSDDGTQVLIYRADVADDSVNQHDESSEELPLVNVPKRAVSTTVSKTVSATKSIPPKSTESTRPVARPVEQHFIHQLASRAVDSEQLKQKLDSVLAANTQPEKAEKLNYGQWVASCIAQVPDRRWAQFLNRSFALIQEFVPRPSAQPQQYGSQSTLAHGFVSQARVSAAPYTQSRMS